tara:strand:- start:1122 stop:1703 length:582 start_codon:yes stop_codon:yes gene_type:complete
MSLVLYSTPTSPFARRIRLLMEPLECEVVSVNFLEVGPRAEFAQVTPIRKVPVLDDDGTRIFDSHVIQQYLFTKLAMPALTIEQSNLLTVMDSVLDSLVIVMMSKRSGIEINNDQLIFALQNERIADSLGWLEKQCVSQDLSEWNYITMSLLSLVHWAQFRDLVDFTDYPAILAAVAPFESLPLVQQTIPANP